MPSLWNPWRGCRKCSTGCLHCYIHKGDAKRGVDTSVITRTPQFYRPVERKRNGEYKMKPGLVWLCFSSDFLIEEADGWRGEVWKMIRERQDCSFLFLTKRITRFEKCLPPDWGDGYDNVYVCCTIEDQRTADERLGVFTSLPIKHRGITAQPLVGPVDLERYLPEIDLVTVGGEADTDGRVMDYSWVLDIRDQCIRYDVSFIFRQCATNFVKDGVSYRLRTPILASQARKAGIDYESERVLFPTGKESSNTSELFS